MTQVPQDNEYMARALRLAARGLFTTHPNPRVGCLIVRDGRVVGEGWHEYAGGPHAEIMALRQAGALAKDATVYVTLEPCCHYGRTGPCTEVLLQVGIKRVVAAMEDPNPKVGGQGLSLLRTGGVDVDSGLMGEAAMSLNPGFIKRMRTGYPYVRVKLGMSLDGRTAAPDGSSQWITGEAARADVQRWRARSDAVMTGINTALADDPSLTVRDLEALGLADPGRVRQPLRVVLDSRLRLAPTARMLGLPGATLVMACVGDDARQAQLERAGAQIQIVEGAAGRVVLEACLAELARREINEVLVEAGPTLSGALVASGMVDELIIYVAPQLLGDRGKGAFSLPAVSGLGDRITLRVRDVRQVGDDLRVVATPLEREG